MEWSVTGILLNVTLHMSNYSRVPCHVATNLVTKVDAYFYLSTRAKTALMLHELQKVETKVFSLVSPKLKHFSSWALYMLLCCSGCMWSLFVCNIRVYTTLWCYRICAMHCMSGHCKVLKYQFFLQLDLVRLSATQQPANIFFLVLMHQFCWFICCLQLMLFCFSYEFVVKLLFKTKGKWDDNIARRAISYRSTDVSSTVASWREWMSRPDLNLLISLWYGNIVDDLLLRCPKAIMLQKLLSIQGCKCDLAVGCCNYSAESVIIIKLLMSP